MEYAYLTHDEPQFRSGFSTTDAQYRGLLYEKKVLAGFEEKYGHLFVPQPWFFYKDRGKKPRWCQPDGLLFCPEMLKLVICEIKLRHTKDAYYQLFELYLPIVMRVFSRWTCGCLEVVRWYDPDEPVPEKARLCRLPEVVSPGVFGVHIWKA